MKRKFFKILIFIYLLFILFLSIFNKDQIFEIIFNTLDIWLYKVFPPIFIFYIISSILISSKTINIITFILKPLKKIFKFETDNAFKLFILSIFMGNPSSSSFIISHLDNQFITKTDANILNKCSSFISPLFIFSIVQFNIALPLYLSHIFANFILCAILTHKNKLKTNNKEQYNINFFDYIDRFPKIIFTIAIFMIICNIFIYSLSLLNINPYYLTFLEISSGSLKIINLNSNLKYYFLLSLFSFNGICIHLQVYSIIKDRLNYLSFFFYRIIQIFISIILFFLINTYFTRCIIVIFNYL